MQWQCSQEQMCDEACTSAEGAHAVTGQQARCVCILGDAEQLHRLGYIYGTEDQGAGRWGVCTEWLTFCTCNSHPRKQKV